MKTPQITIGMPVFNDVLFIYKSIKSILSQTFTDFILIISDDGSTDGSQQICEKYVELDSRVKYIRQPKNLGISKNMQYLLSLSETPYFMWAGDDDLMDETYVEKLHDALEKNPDAVSAFGTCAFINEYDDILRMLDFDYTCNGTFKRLMKYIKRSTDFFGYGLFRYESIKDVEFPIWKWPNKNTPYNNIFPTLIYYLAKGPYIHIGGNPIFFKRVKEQKNINHQIIGGGHGLYAVFAYTARRINLVAFSVRQVHHAKNFLFAYFVMHWLVWYWAVIPICTMWTRSTLSFLKRKLK